MKTEKQFQAVNNSELQKVDGGNGFYASVGSNQIVVMPGFSGQTISNNSASESQSHEDVGQKLQFEISLPSLPAG